MPQASPSRALFPRRGRRMAADAARDAFARFLRALLGALGALAAGAAPEGADPADTAGHHRAAAGHRHAAQQDAEALLEVHAEDALQATARVLGAPGYSGIVAEAAPPGVRLGLLQARPLSAPCRLGHAGFHARTLNHRAISRQYEHVWTAKNEMAACIIVNVVWSAGAGSCGRTNV